MPHTGLEAGRRAFVATYLCFCWNPLDPAVPLRVAPGDRLARWLRRADVLGRFAWVGDPQARAIGWRTALRVAIQSPLLHPAVLWYVGFWLFFLLPWQPWTWADDPILLAISLLALAILAWSWLRRPRPAQLADG